MAEKRKRERSGSGSDSEYVPGSPESESDEESAGEASCRKFIDYLAAWLQANRRRVDAAYDSGKGWENWLHVDLFLYVKGQDEDARIAREPHSYPGKSAGLRADYVFEDVTVEIKTEGESQTPAAFAAGVGADAKKVGKLSKGDYAIVIGVCRSTGSRDALRGEVELVSSITGDGPAVHYGYTSSS